MKQQYAEKLLALQKLAMQDEYYLSLLAEYRAMDRRFVQALEEMLPRHRDIVMDYMGAFHAANARMLEIALRSDEKC